MTIPLPTGIPPRQPQRGSVSALAPQQNAHRPSTLPQQQLLSSSASPITRDPPPSAASTSHAPDPPPLLPPATTPTRARSKLRLELSTSRHGNDCSGELASTAESSPPSNAPDADGPSPAQASVAFRQESDNPPLPLPKRPPRSSQPFSPLLRPSPSSAPPAKPREAKAKAFTVEVPSLAPHLPATGRNEISSRDPFSKALFSGNADFFPWSGSHHEDEWSSEAIQKGMWDRGNQNEISSARLAIFPSLKQKSGLNALSTVFMGVLSQRRHRGQITAPCTFKPPPRVTLTDTKREVWLKDLANPAISLRRLSRTIPHGIRGRTLLDQCLKKSIPTERAVWLAKCVGANEIRAFKRKGAGGALVIGGELKWVRDWTVFVEQFLEAVLVSFTEPDWKARVTYAIRLATKLYHDQLLDQDHYLDWITTSLETSPQARIPMWLLIAQITWTDLLRSRKHGRRLVYVLLCHLHSVQNDPDRDALTQLSGQLSNLLATLIKSNPESFVSPHSWPKYRDVLLASLSDDDRLLRAAFDRVNTRNRQMSAANVASPPAARQHLVRLLDSAILGHGVQNLPAKCWAVIDDKSDLMKMTVEWATSLYRPGLTKIYVAVWLVRSWSTYDIDTTSTMIDLLGGMGPSEKLRNGMVYHLVAELIRAGLFSVSRYMQWLIGRGGLRSAADIDPDDGPCASRLLVELPIHCLSESQMAERSNLLRRAGHYWTAEEAKDIFNAMNCVRDTLGLSFRPGDAETSRKTLSLKRLLVRISRSNRAVQSSISAMLADICASRSSTSAKMLNDVTKFRSLRAILETAEDFSLLSQVLTASVAAAPNVEVLAVCADTTHAHLGIFLALGCADDCFDALVDRLKFLKCEQGISVRPLLAALSNLAKALPNREEVAQQLSRDLAQSDRTNVIDACSPVSDSMAIQSQGAEGEASEQIERFLMSGNTVDQPTMNRLFRNIIPKLEAGWAKMDDSRRVFASLLARLRVFDARHFDKLMTDWISHIRTLKERPRLLELFPLLVSLDCLSVSTMLTAANAGPATMDDSPSDEVSEAAAQPGSAVYMQELLQLVIMTVPVSPCLQGDELYRFRIQQQSARLGQAKALLLLIRRALIEYGTRWSRAPGREDLLDNFESKSSLADTLQHLVVADSTAVASNLNAASLPARAAILVNELATKLLVPHDRDLSEASFDLILELANELTMPFCQLKINLDLSGSYPGAGEGESEMASRYEAFAMAMDRAIEARNILWTSMLPCLSQEITCNLSKQARARFLELVPSPKSPTFVSDAVGEHRVHLAENLLSVMQAIVSGPSAPQTVQLTANLVDRLSDLWEVVASREEERAEARQSVLHHWLPALLRFITLHGASAEPSPTMAAGAGAGPSGAARAPLTQTHEVKARILLAVCGLLVELDSRPETAEGQVCQQAFDVGMMLADDLGDETRLQCARTMLLMPGSAVSTATASDRRLYYLLSVPPPSAEGNLRLSHRDKLTSARAMGAAYGIGPAPQDRLAPFFLRRWELLSEPTPIAGDNDTSLSLALFEAIRIR